MPNLVELIKQIIVETNNSQSLTNVLFGTVISTTPLKINVEQKFDLTEEFLILTKNVKNYTVDVSVNWKTENVSLNADHSHIATSDSGNVQVEEKTIDLAHNHNITGRKSITIYNELKNGDKVMLIQIQGGQQFVVLDKY